MHAEQMHPPWLLHFIRHIMTRTRRALIAAVTSPLPGDRGGGPNPQIWLPSCPCAPFSSRRRRGDESMSAEPNDHLSSLCRESHVTESVRVSLSLPSSSANIFRPSEPVSAQLHWLQLQKGLSPHTSSSLLKKEPALSVSVSVGLRGFM